MGRAGGNMTAQELINKLQAIIAKDTMLATAEVKVLHPEFDTLTNIKIFYPVIPSRDTAYLQLI